MVQVIIMLFPIPLVGFWFWMFRDMTNNGYLSPRERNDWLFRFIFLNIFGAYWYYLVEFKNRNV